MVSFLLLYLLLLPTFIITSYNILLSSKGNAINISNITS